MAMHGGALEPASGKASEARTLIFSGIQPTGEVHLGNYFGAIQQWIELQEEACATLFCIVDLHALTTHAVPGEEPMRDVLPPGPGPGIHLRTQVLELAALLLAAGLDPEKAILFVQSANPDHARLNWLFHCIARIGWLNRMTQFKDKAGKNREKASVGLYSYPVLMAADILAYHGTLVPVGEDQRQHLELTREIAQKFNQTYGVSFFPLPEVKQTKVGARIMSLRDGTKKMSKSEPSALSRIHLSDSRDLIAKKIKGARTDSALLPGAFAELAARPEARNLVTLYAASLGQEPESLMADLAGQTFETLKKKLTESLIASLEPVRTRFLELRQNTDELVSILDRGAARAQALSTPIVDRAFELAGLQGPARPHPHHRG